MKSILCALVTAVTLFAQETAPPPAIPKPNQNRVFVLKYADARNVANVLSVFGVGALKADRDLHVVAVSAPSDVMPVVEEAVNRLDVPTAAPKDIDLTVYMVVASEQGNGMDGLPADLQSVANELKRIFAYKSFRLLDSVLLRTQPNNRAQADGVIAPANGRDTPYSFSVVPTGVTEDTKGRMIRLDNMQLNLRMPGDHNAGIHTEITVREGQRVVVGKSNMGTDQALILVVTAKVTE